MAAKRLALHKINVKKASGIYMITCLSNHRTYIGSTRKPFRERWWIWESKLNSKEYEEHLLMKLDWQKHGEKNFAFIALRELPSSLSKMETLIEEQWYLDHFKTSIKKKDGYNVAKHSAILKRKKPPTNPPEPFDIQDDFSYGEYAWEQE